MTAYISVIIPNYNGAATIGKCLEAALASAYEAFEVIVVDDGSTDNSVEIIKGYPCRLVQLAGHAGASKARNTGALHSKGDLLFFIDADCLVNKEALAIAAVAYAGYRGDVIVGGTYTPRPYDRRFFSRFQSAFINYFETKHPGSPDYIATHAMLIDSDRFKESGGFAEDFMPILEDVEYSHRMKARGFRLVMSPGIRVRHIFNYSLSRSIANGIRKSAFWTRYSLKNRDLLADSGTASKELKMTVVSYLVTLVLAALWLFSRNTVPLALLAVFCSANIFINRRLLRAFYDAGGLSFALPAALYYLWAYPVAVGIGGLVGLGRSCLEEVHLPARGCGSLVKPGPAAPRGVILRG